MRWYQVFINLASKSSGIVLPAGSDLRKAIDIGKHFLNESGDLNSNFRVFTVPDASSPQPECVYKSSNDELFKCDYRLQKCEQALTLCSSDPSQSISVELPDFLKKQAC